jgi:hypothetical protein
MTYRSSNSASTKKGDYQMRCEMKEPRETKLKQRYTPKPVPANSFVTSKSPLNNTKSVRVMRWHDYHGKPVLFLVCDKYGHELCRFPYEPDALGHASALEGGTFEPDKE